SGLVLGKKAGPARPRGRCQPRGPSRSRQHHGYGAVASIPPMTEEATAGRRACEAPVASYPQQQARRGQSRKPCGHIIFPYDAPARAFIVAATNSREDMVHDAEVRYSQGNALMLQGRFAEAAVCYEAALRLRPGHAETHNNLAVALAEQGQ